jgi:hypothetical protein
MKIRTGFVSNSSSTSFLIISRDELEEASFFQLMGVARTSPIRDLFREFYEDVITSVSTEIDFNAADPTVPIEAWFDRNRRKPSAYMMEKIKSAREHGLRVYFGSLDSETSNIQTFFCTDSFEVENEKIYFNGLECVW